MNVETIAMNPAQAQSKMLAYRQALRRRKAKEVREEYERLETAYSELAKGRTLIDPIAAIRESGFNEQGLPNLAIARADRKFVQLHMNSYGEREKTIAFNSSRFDRWSADRRTVGMYFSVPDMPEGGKRPDWRGARAMVPLIPVDVRPTREGSERDWHILFEAEWEPYTPPVDPILLKRIHGDLFTVLAAWDLTPIERSVLAAMRNGE